MRANRAFALTVSPGGREPAFLAGPGRRDRIEVVAIEDGEPLLFWELAAGEAGRLVRRLRADLSALSVEEFRTLWEGADHDADRHAD